MSRSGINKVSISMQCTTAASNLNDMLEIQKTFFESVIASNKSLFSTRERKEAPTFQERELIEETVGDHLSERVHSFLINAEFDY